MFSPHYELFKTETQFVVVTKELRVCWDFIQKDLRHLQRALEQRWGGERKDKYKGRALYSQKNAENRASKERQASFRPENDFLSECLLLHQHHKVDIRSEKGPRIASCMVNVTTAPAYIHHLSPICPEWDLVILTYIHHKTTADLSSAWISTGSVKQPWLS